MKDVADWQAIAVYTDLIHSIEDLPNPETDEGWEERQRLYRFILEKRKVHVDAAYELYFQHERKPWCDVCETGVVLREMFGWVHTGFYNADAHPVSTHEYAAGCEAEIIKRLKFEI